MEYTLMHKNVPVAELEIDEEIGAITKIADVYAREHLPVGIELTSGAPNRKWLNDWWRGRAIPASRSGLRSALETMQVSSPVMLLTKCFGLSLSDQYWVRFKANPISWESVNFFQNTFSEDVGNALFGREFPPGGKLSLMSPDNTSDGWLNKKWVISENTRMLVKSGSEPYFQEPLNEVLASAVARRLGIPHVEYTLSWEDERPLSLCEDFITPATEFVTVWHILQTTKRPNHISEYQHFTECCSKLGIPGSTQSLNEMLVLDFIIANSDRHYNNFGAVRNADTLEWLGLAPVFDCGTSLWFNKIPQEIHLGSDEESKPFRNKHSQQIALVTDFAWLELDKLHGIDEEFAAILKQSRYIDEVRRATLCKALCNRVKMLDELVREKSSF